MGVLVKTVICWHINGHDIQKGAQGIYGSCRDSRLSETCDFTSFSTIFQSYQDDVGDNEWLCARNPCMI